jgi:hypothetical protein
MGDFSRAPSDVLLDNQQKGYVGIHIQQSVPLLDRDLNLLHDLVAATMRTLIGRYVGSGLPAGASGFAIQALPSGQNTQDFRITAGDAGPGVILVGGVEAVIPAAISYSGQPGVPALTTPGTAGRTDIVYVDVFLNEVDSTTDATLSNSQDVGIETSVRLVPAFVVRVAEGVTTPAGLPAPPAGHAFAPLARLQRTGAATIDASMIGDLRQRRLTVADLERRMSLLERVLLLPAFVTPPLPQFIPKSGDVNQAITLNGSNFNVGSIQVQFGALPAAVVGTPTATRAVALVPGGLTPAGVPVAVPVTVTTAGGTVVSDELFTAFPAPAFASPGGQLSPMHGPPGTQVTLTGFNFNVGTPQVQFGTLPATLVGTPTATQIVAQVPAGLVPAGSTTADVKVNVTTSAGSIASDDNFRAETTIPAPAFVAPPLPQFIPKSGAAGQTITLNGQNFNFPPVTVQFDTTNAVVVGSPSATQIAVQVPSGLAAPGTTRAVKIAVTTAGGTVPSTESFTVTG